MEEQLLDRLKLLI